mmetsp:Transcript_55078/g.128876  ORF Transcript_55078/g.128876 Transcript_55078/m.128876 type:complete len:234 (+) Transcript_55078:362-1063(+)
MWFLVWEFAVHAMSGTSMRFAYAMPGTAVAYACTTYLGAHYAMCGTEIAGAARRRGGRGRVPLSARPLLPRSRHSRRSSSFWSRGRRESASAPPSSTQWWSSLTASLLPTSGTATPRPRCSPSPTLTSTSIAPGTLSPVTRSCATRKRRRRSEAPSSRTTASGSVSPGTGRWTSTTPRNGPPPPPRLPRPSRPSLPRTRLPSRPLSLPRPPSLLKRRSCPLLRGNQSTWRGRG